MIISLFNLLSESYGISLTLWSSKLYTVQLKKKIQNKEQTCVDCSSDYNTTIETMMGKHLNLKKKIFPDWS